MHCVTLIVAAFLVLGAIQVNADVSQDAEATAAIYFDFIVVGAGGAGSVVAARLAKETNKKILLLEGGALGSGQRDLGGNSFVALNFKVDPNTGKLVQDIPLTIYDVPQYYDLIRQASDVLNNTWPITPVGPFYSQVKAIGGNMASNGMVWLCPQNHEFDNWGIPGFSGAEMRQIVIRVENATETGNTFQRGTAGPINIKYGSFYKTEQQQFKDAAIASGYTYNPDIGAPEVPPGIYRGQANVKRGIRQSTSLAYLRSALGLPNLIVLPSATVTRVLFSTSPNALPKAIGVEFVDFFGIKRTVNAALEVILATGDLQTSKILYNSGIGPNSILTAFNKPKIVVNEVIGQKIRNHQRASMVFNSSSIQAANFLTVPAAMNQYARNGTGLFDTYGVHYLVTNASNGNTTTILGVIAGATPSPYSTMFGVIPALNNNAYANGTMNLTSSDPLAPTIFKANVFEILSDAVNVARALIEVRRVMKNWPGGGLPEISPGPAVNTVDEFVAYIRANPGTACHYYGAAPMGLNADAPTNPRMLLNKVTGLRFAGPAVVPGPVRLGMQCLAVLLGEKATDLIKADYGL